MRSRSRLLVVLICLLVGGLLPASAAAQSPSGQSSLSGKANPLYVRQPQGPSTADLTPSGYSPQQLWQAYGFTSLEGPGAGSGKTIGIVDAYDDPTIANDLEFFINYYGLNQMNGLPGQPPCTIANGPAPCFQKIHTGFTTPAANPDWASEISLDVEWAHAIAQGANILLVETPNNLLSSLLSGVQLATARGANVVSISWGNITDDPTALNAYFASPGVSYVAAAGDEGGQYGLGAEFPAEAPYVISVGGTSLPLSTVGAESVDVGGNRTGPETVWNDQYGATSGGIALYEAEPGYQSSLPIPFSFGRRGTPDVAYDADPATGISVYDSTPDTVDGTTYVDWQVFGGTSVGAPQWAGLIAIADSLGGMSLSTDSVKDSFVYDAASASYSQNFYDIVLGNDGGCGFYCTALPGYDFATGLGSPNADNLIPWLVEEFGSPPN